MIQHRTFLDVTLDDDGLHTPDGVIALADITRGEVVRHRSRDAGSPHDSYNGEVTGAIVGGTLGGPVGFLTGAVLGGAIARDDADYASVPRTVSATMSFESPALAYSRTVGKDQAVDAEAFVAAVKKAAGLE